MSKNEPTQEKTMPSYENKTIKVLEVLQGAHRGGATVEYGDLLIHKDHNGEQETHINEDGNVNIRTPFGPVIYTVTDADEEETLDAINVWAFRSIDELQAYLDDLDRRHGDPHADKPPAVAGGPGRSA